ncbi:chaplin [Streptomyces sp. NPDC049577]|uniref:chaplin n=1 Tax=Streptomyces sp. NPDC049577 TaxID=3155153 RepID=UPI003428957C
MNSAKKAALVLAAAGVVVGAGVGAASANDDGATAVGVAKGSPGVISGNVIQVPIDIPINLCGNTINIVGLLNPTFGNVCINGDAREEHFEHRERHEFGEHHTNHHEHHRR